MFVISGDWKKDHITLRKNKDNNYINPEHIETSHLCCFMKKWRKCGMHGQQHFFLTRTQRTGLSLNYKRLGNLTIYLYRISIFSTILSFIVSYDLTTAPLSPGIRG